MLAAWIVETLGGAPVVVTTGLSAFIAALAAGVRVYRLKLRQHMHAARLAAAQDFAKDGSVAVLLEETRVVVIPASSPLTVDDLLRATGSTEVSQPANAAPPKEVAGRTAPSDLPPPS